MPISEAGEKSRYLCSDRAAERVYKGVWGAGAISFSVGRIYIPHIAAAAPEELSILCLIEGDEEWVFGRESRLLGFSGVVMTSSTVSPELLALMARTGMPYLILKESLPAELAGRVAVLDTKRDIIIISPELDTLSFYSKARGMGALKTPDSLYRKQNGDSALLYAKDGRTAMLRELPNAHPEELTQQLITTAEELCGTPLTLGIQAPRDEEGEERFRREAEAIFRAAVYGSFSIRLEGYSHEYDVQRALSLLHRVFCELEQDGREFNGYLPRGLLIDAPLWLTCPSPMRSPDLICFDFDKLTASLLGREPCHILRDGLPRELIFGVWERYFSEFAPHCRLQATAGILGDTELFEEWCRLAGINEVFINK